MKVHWIGACALVLATACGPSGDDERDPFGSGATPPGATSPDGGDDGGVDDAMDDDDDDGGVDDAADDAADDGGNDGSSTGCDFDTDAAIRVTVNVTWEGGLAVLAGGGAIKVWMLGHLAQDGTDIHLSGSVCRLELPDFQTGAIAGGETYGTMFADAIWTSPAIPTIDAIATLSASEPGATLQLPAGGVVLGAQLGDPLGDPWPSSWSGLATVDHDGDGRPGITANAKTGGNYAYPRIDILNSDARAEALYIASRTILELDGIVQSCDQAAGDVHMTMENHAVGCKIVGGGDCSSGQTGTLDNNMPVFQVQTGVFALSRLLGPATCADVFAALP